MQPWLYSRVKKSWVQYFGYSVSLNGTTWSAFKRGMVQSLSKNCLEPHFSTAWDKSLNFLSRADFYPFLAFMSHDNIFEKFIFLELHTAQKVTFQQHHLYEGCLLGSCSFELLLDCSYNMRKWLLINHCVGFTLKSPFAGCWHTSQFSCLTVKCLKPCAQKRSQVNVHKVLLELTEKDTLFLILMMQHMLQH